MNKRNLKALEKALWSVALPGFGQLLNGKYFKGILLILSEFIINNKANLNLVIVESFYGNISKAISISNYQWIMFYPCLYLFGIFDAYRDGLGEERPLLFLPFVFSAYTTTVAVIYSKTLRINGVLMGPIFLPILTIFISLIIGFILRKIILKYLMDC